MKAVLEFQLPEESVEHLDAVNGASWRCKFEEVWDVLFRPRHKHGYGDKEITELMDSETGEKIMDYLEQKYLEIAKDDE